MDYDSLFLIFEHLNFDDLLSVAEVNGEFSALATDVYRSKYSKWRIIVNISYMKLPHKLKRMLNVTDSGIGADAIDQIDRDLRYLSNERPQLIENDNYNFIKLNNYKTILMTFKHFGREIKKFQASSDVPESLFMQSLLGYLLGEYSNESLVQIKFLGACGKALKYITKPLINVESVTLATYFVRVDDDNDEIPQRINTLLPNIKKFEISHFWQEKGSIQSEKVTTLVIREGYYTSPQNLHFPQLQILHADYDSKYFSEYLTFLNEHCHLSQLHLTGVNMNDLEFESLTENLTDLVEISLKRTTDITGLKELSADAVLKFLGSHDKVKQLSVSGFDWNLYELREQLQDDWNTETIKYGLSFQRK